MFASNNMDKRKKVINLEYWGYIYKNKRRVAESNGNPNSKLVSEMNEVLHLLYTK